MPVTLIGGGPSTAIDRTNTFRYRITWAMIASSILPDGVLDAHRAATALQEALPSVGIIPVSPVAAVAGDPFVQFTCMIGSTGPGSELYTLADLIAAGDRLPLFSIGDAISLRISLDVSEIEIRAAGLPNVIVAAQDAASRQRAFEAAEKRDVATKLENLGAGIADVVKDAAGATGSKIDEYFKQFFGGLADIAKLTVGLLGITAIVYVVVRYQK